MYTRDQAARVAQALRTAGEYPLNLRPLEPPPPSFSIAMSREAGAGGALVAAEVGRRLNWPVYDRELLNQIAEELKVHVHRLEGIDERPGSRLVECLESFASPSSLTEVTYFRRLAKLILTLGERGACVIVGRGSTFLLPLETTLRVRVVAGREQRVETVAAERGISRADAARFIDESDRERRRFIKDHFHKEVGNPEYYDVTLNSSRFSVDECATVVIEALARLQARKAAR